MSPRQAEPASFYVETDVVVHSSLLHSSLPHSHSPISQNAETYKDTPRSINGRDIAWRVASHWGQCRLFLLRQPTCHRQIVNENVTYFSHPKLVPTTRYNTAHLEQRQQRNICTRTCLSFSTAAAARLQATAAESVETTLHLAATGRLTASWVVQMPGFNTPISHHSPTTGRRTAHTIYARSR